MVLTEEATRRSRLFQFHINKSMVLYRKLGKSMKIKFKNNKILFPVKIWKVHDEPMMNLYCQHRTNNIYKSWNDRFMYLVGHKHSTVWKLISKLRSELEVDRFKTGVRELDEAIPEKKSLEVCLYR